MEFITAKTILSKTKKSDFWFDIDYGTNLYRGCSHGCIYCDSRSECYKVENFENVKAKKNALQIFQKELASKRKRGIIATGAMSDPYNPLEKDLLLTAGFLELIDQYKFGVCIYTKSDLILRDIPLLKKIQEHSKVVICITITTFDDDLSKRLEPNAPSTSCRFEALRQLKEAGLITGILLMPLLPWINDTKENITAIIQKGAQCSVDFIYPMFGLTLRDIQRDYFYNKVDQLFPGLSENYKKHFGNQYVCNSPAIKELSTLLHSLCKQHQIKYSMKEINTLLKEKKESYEILQWDL